MATHRLYSSLGAVYGQESRFSAAVAPFEIAVQITPNDPEYLINLATAFRAVGRIDDARKALRAALAAAPDYDPARAALEQMGPIRNSSMAAKLRGQKGQIRPMIRSCIAFQRHG
jgi:Flp pilus assembly protein TadD